MENLPKPHIQWAEIQRKAKQIPRVVTNPSTLAFHNARVEEESILSQIKSMTHNYD